MMRRSLTESEVQHFANRLAQAAWEKGDYASVPIPRGDDQTIELATRVGTYGKLIDSMPSFHKAIDAKHAPPSERCHRNVLPHKGIVLIHWRDDDGKWHIFGDSIIGQRLELQLEALTTVRSVGADAERIARANLLTHLSEQQQDDVLLTNTFGERGASGHFYVIRASRPTIVFQRRPDTDHPIAALCTHPLGYYTGTHVGVLAPSDEMLATILMVRADEHYLWRKANQLNVHDPLAGL